MKKATIAATAGIAVTAFAAPTIASASTVVVEAGDTLWGIAQSKGTTVDAIKKANNLTTDKIVPGQKLQVNNEVAAAEKTEKSVSATWLNVRSGAGVDNSIITSIKGGTKVTVETTESNGWHKITYNDGKTGFVNGKYLTDKAVSTPVAPTQEVKKETTTQQAAPAAETKTEVEQTTQATTPAPKVAETKETPVVDQNATTHAVKSGDTIWALSVKYGVSVQDIMSWNNLSSSSIYVGQKLAIKQTANTATPKAEVKTEAPAAEKQAAPVVKENTNTNTATTEKKETATQQQTAPKAPTEAAKPAPAPSTNTNANKTNT
ncbi:TPA: LysM peptidoglycan-binding domain-containing protein, partial [Listeria monocytogenes]|nr:LysM peptidoglycan-binding domain-containing protein [Listeria monocytogenes]